LPFPQSERIYLPSVPLVDVKKVKNAAGASRHLEYAVLQA
jgi:hypothetical protein